GAPALETSLIAGAVEDNPAHGLGRGGEEVAAAVPVPRLLDIDQPNIGFMDQGRGLERLAGLLVRPFRPGQPTHFLIDQGQQLLRRQGVTLLDGRKDAGHVRHRYARRRVAHALSPNGDRATVPGERSSGPGPAPRRLASRLSLVRSEG